MSVCFPVKIAEHLELEKREAIGMLEFPCSIFMLAFPLSDM